MAARYKCRAVPVATIKITKINKICHKKAIGNIRQTKKKSKTVTFIYLVKTNTNQSFKNLISPMELDGSLPANPLNDQRIANAVTLKSTFRLP